MSLESEDRVHVNPYAESHLQRGPFRDERAVPVPTRRPLCARGWPAPLRA